MTGVIISRTAEVQLEDIFAFGFERWGAEQASRYSDALIDKFYAIAARKVLWRPVPASFDVVGFYCRTGSHYIYWRYIGDEVRIVAILHERMQQLERLQDALNDD